MAKYKLTNQAVKDLSKIWKYTFDAWSEKQADNYYQSLITNCHNIAINPELGKKYEGISNQLLGLKANRHIIFYRTVKKNYVEITRIIHERMDIKKRLIE